MDITGKDCLSVAPPLRTDPTNTFSHNHRVSITIEPQVSSRVTTGYAFTRPPSINFEPLKSEQARFNTFSASDCPWPVPFISPADCAKAGFFFLKDGDKVQCAFCRGVAGEWDEGDVPMVEHKKHFPRCPFLCNLPVGNIRIDQEPENPRSTQQAPPVHEYGLDICGRGPFEAFADSDTNHQVHIRGAYPLTVDKDDVTSGLGIQTSGPARKHLVTLPTRLKTFADWPQSTGQTPHKMADAGFFYIGVADHVKCFYCDGGLKNWEQSDDPWREHARWFATCPYVLLMKGQDYIKEVARTKPVSEQHKNPVCSQSSEDEDAASSSGISSEGEEAQGSTFSTGSDSPPPSSSDIGISSDSSDDDMSQPTVAAESQQEKDSRKISDCLALSPPDHVVPEKPKCQEDLAEEVRLLKEARQCKICMDNEANVVFLPCGHLVSCVRCATALSNCALCRQPIKAVVRTYF